MELPVLSFESAKAWATWLAEHHDTAAGIWLRIAKKESGIASVTYAEALDVALCHGWIDGQKASDETGWWRQRFTPRTARSKWSQINCAKALALIDSGEMEPSGLRQVELAQADGRWASAYAGQRAAEVPEDLRQALAGDPAAREFFATLDSQNRYAILYRVQDAKRPETRARRIEKFVTMLSAGERIYP